MITKAFPLFFSLFPIASLGLAAQCLYAWIYPHESFSQNFFSVLSDLFIFEVVFMHSELFWQGRNLLFARGKGKQKKDSSKKSNLWLDVLWGVFLFVAYGLFILPMYDKNPFLVWNYILLCVFRFTLHQSTPWYTNTGFYKTWVNGETQIFFTFIMSFLKLFYLALLLPFIITFLPLPEFGLTADVVKLFSTNENDPYGVFILIKTMFLYFMTLAVFDIYGRICQKS